MLKFPVSIDHSNSDKYEHVTSFISRQSPPFDGVRIAKEISTNCGSIYYEMEVEDILYYWKLATEFGNIQHQKIENYIRKNQSCDFDEFFQQNNIGFENSYSEIKLTSDIYQLTGTADIIVREINEDKTIYRIHDIKTYKNITDEKILKASVQILLYCMMLNNHLGENEIAIPGKILHISNVSHPTNQDISTWKISKPYFVNFDKNAIKEVKKYLGNEK